MVVRGPTGYRVVFGALLVFLFTSQTVPGNNPNILSPKCSTPCSLIRFLIGSLDNLPNKSSTLHEI